MDEKESVALEARKYELLDNLTHQEGWPILLDHLTRIKEVIVEALLVEKDQLNITRLQERYRAFNSVINTLQSAKSLKEKLYEDIKIIIEDENLRKDFDV